MMRAVVLAVLLVATASVESLAQAAPAPTGRCRLTFESDRLITIQLPSKQYNSYLGGNVIGRCPAQKMVLKADSLESYGDEGRFYFVGHVDYVEPRAKLKSDFLTYFQREERLLAFSNVDAKLPSGSTLKGSSLEYFRSIPKVRPKQRIVAVGRPTVALVEKDAQGKPQPPVTVTGNNIWMDGDSVVSSQGEVVIVRPELTATGDSLFIDNGVGILRIMRTPKLTGTKGRPFTLVGETIDLLTVRRKLNRVLAKNAAEAKSEDLDLKADTIDLRVVDDLLQRAIAWGKSRANATSPSQTMIADSIDVLMPGQRVREIHALRMATAEGVPDTTKFRTTEKDRLMGDTIIATFDTIPSKDTSAKPRLKRLVAIGTPTSDASSLQTFPPRDTSYRTPEINYVTGKKITVVFDSAGVKTVDVVGQKQGIYVQPDSTRKGGVVGAPPATPAGTTPPGSRPPGSPVPNTQPPTTPAVPPKKP
ncbi:MAG: hypothetical protein ABIY52_02125 [Gemmatimonadaceae bacterium]